MIVIDTETTGLNYEPNSEETDEVLQLSIIDEDGNCLYNSYFKPARHSAWDGAMAVNGITPDFVGDAPSFESEIQKINTILNCADSIGGYNTPFDIAMLQANGVTVPNVPVIDAMREFPEEHREWSETHQAFKWVKLCEAAEFYGYEWKGAAHDSLADCLATLFVIKAERAEQGQ